MKEITLEELSVMQKDSYVLIDIRDEGLASYGMIPGAVNIPVDTPEEEQNKRIAEIPKEKKLIFYCQIGHRSRELDDLACIEGRKAFSLQDGYIGYIRFRAAIETNSEERQLKAEDSMSFISTISVVMLRWVTKAQFSTKPNWAFVDFPLSTFA